MSCNNCFNGCSETTSDQCVKYTGSDVPALNITNGDSLASIEASIFSFLTSILTGSNIVPVIDPNILCSLVSNNLPDPLPVINNEVVITLNSIIEAIVKSICDLKIITDNITTDLGELNAEYVIGCLEGVTVSSSTHDVLQAAITKLCTISDDLDLLTIALGNYVLTTDLNSLIAAYLASNAPQNIAKDKMIPYVAVPYFGTSSGYPTGADGFDSAGAGYGYWDKIYFCNGVNGTPDLRGRTTVGFTDGSMVGGAMRTDVNPAIPGSLNPSYGPNQYLGTNNVTLNATQIPLHTHGATSTATSHTHFDVVPTGTGTTLSSTNSIIKDYNYGAVDHNYSLAGVTTVPTIGLTSPNSDFVITTTVLAGPTGGNLPHANNQPALGSLYIIYIP